MNTMRMIYVLKIHQKIMNCVNLFNYISMTTHAKYKDFYAFTIHLDGLYLRCIVIIHNSLKLKLFMHVSIR